ncbi:RCC1/BLIP-II [Lojkania enalia]|uniref:RCC1/BLIP-II n=1 Tax=Lojkania enalia TaxID=147567 RepID=A0A9P4K041_9PLEO|nr:RCC1/BLIP-II [Didymosphaeria enalia]
MTKINAILLDINAMAERVSSITDLPLDILVLVFPYLSAKDFLAFCSTCTALHQQSIRLDPAYWNHAVRSTFRVPNRPIVQHDGARWQKLYRRLFTQSRVFTWGSNTYNRLGHSFQRQDVDRTRAGMARRRFMMKAHCSFPTEMDNTRDLGVIADMQCGGWSTTLLTSKGTLHTVGVLDGQQVLHYHRADLGPHCLQFPAIYKNFSSQPTFQDTAILQFSAGRSHILGLSDSGRIWSWYEVLKPALNVKFLNIEIEDRVRKVVAGWSCSSAYIHGIGIVLWDPVRRERTEDETDTMLVMETVEVPMTSYRRVKGAARKSEEQVVLGKDIGAVVNWIVLEHFIVFVTDIGKVFCCKLGGRNRVDGILELDGLRNESGTPSDVQGSFRRFAIFKNGEVIISDQEYLEACWNAKTHNLDQVGLEGLKRIPSLQHNDVIAVAFGDYHFLALHSNGKITSYGTEMQACGALGLGGDGDPEGRIRGIRYTGFSHDGKLLPHAYTHGRQVWFELQKKKFITFMTSGGKNPDEAKERMHLFVTDRNVQGEVSEWFEQEGRDWDKGPAVQDANEDGLGSYFVLSISAAGWHSGAVVLVNEKLAAKVKEQHIIKDEGNVESTDNIGEEHGEGSSALLASASSWLATIAQNFLGLQRADQQRQTTTQDALQGDVTLSSFLDPIAHGTSPAKGYQYTWAKRNFPRLRLSDGREMPGSVGFDEWKYGRPEWQLDVDV